MKKALQYTLLTAIFLGIAYYIASDWDIRFLIGIRLDVKNLFISIGLLTARFFLACSLSHQLVKCKKEIKFLSYQKIYFLSQLGRYLPGKIWMVLGKVESLRRKGFDVWWITTASVLEMLLMGLGALLVVVSYLSFNPIGKIEFFSRFALLLLIGCIVISVFSQSIIQFCLKSGRLVFKSFASRISGTIQKQKQGKLSTITLGYCFCWIIQGVAFYFLIYSLLPNTPFSYYFVFAYTIAWLTGFVTVFSPAGIGVRESMLIVLLSMKVSTTEAAVIAMLARVWATGTELSIAFISLIATRKGPLS